MAKRNGQSASSVESELVAIKRLLVLALLRSGSNQKEIAAALGLNQSQISRMLPGKVGRVSVAPRGK